MNDAGAIADLLADRPDLEEPLEHVLTVDQREDTWTFDDLSIESGPFGELVSRGVVESVGDEYRLADQAATRQALDADAAGESAGASPDAAGTTAGSARPSADSAGTASAVSLPSAPALPTVDRTTGGLIAAAIAVVALVRLHAIGTVYRNGDVVLAGNDPYYYRYWIERVAGASGGALDFGALSELPVAVQKGEPLMVATLWWLAELLGGGVAAIGHVLAWYPVVSAVVTAGFVYLLATKLTGDRRIGVAAVLLLAIVPGHALRTAVGFADHHAFDYPWLAGTALALVSLVGVDRDDFARPRTWLVAAGLGVCVAGQVLAWEAGPLLIAPVGIAVLASSLIAIRADRSPLVAGTPVLAGLAVGAVLAAAVHLVAGWHTAEVAFAPTLVLAGSVLVVGVAAGVRRTTGEPLHALAVDLVGGAAVLGVVALAFPASWQSLLGQLDRLVRSDAIAETNSLFDPGTMGFILLLGFTLVLALPAMVSGLRRAADDGRWAVLVTYAWYFLLLAGLQVRFVGELAAFAAVFAGVGFVWMAAWIDAIEWPDLRERTLAPLTVPDRGTVLTLALLFALVGSLGIVQTPVKTSQTTIGADEYASASFVEERSAALNQTHPENRVISDWGQTRMYNYFVSGESASYSYAQSNYADFAQGTDPDSWYERFDGRVGYVVMATADDDTAPGSTLWRLTREYGSAFDATDGVAHFQALYRAPGDTRTVFAVVPGARLTGTAGVNETVTLSTAVEVEGADFEYTRQTATNATGHYAVRVANPGQYEVSSASVDGNVTVSPAAVRTGESVAVEAAG